MIDISQLAIPVLSGSSIWAMSNKRYKLGFLFGIVGQPFWFYSTYAAEQWGMFAISFWFAINHIKGFITHEWEG